MAADTFIKEELDSVRDVFKIQRFVTVESCHKELLQFKIRHTDYKELVVKIQFPVDYPHSILYIESTSKHISENLLKGMISVCEQELKTALGKPQILKAFTFLNDFILNNPFVVCSDEVSYIKKSLHREDDTMKIKQKSGVFTYKAVHGSYFIEFIVTVPFQYPSHHVNLEIKNCNLPSNIYSVIKGQSDELLRQSVEPPVRRQKHDSPFEPKPSLKAIFDFLVIEGIRRYPNEVCPICHETALSPDPKKIAVAEESPMYVYRMYCGHLYHHKCLEIYMKTPPFEGGKKCSSCGERLAHEKWNVPPKIAEERWAHQEAKKREIAEVADFLGFD